jgi:hypothetical protein
MEENTIEEAEQQCFLCLVSVRKIHSSTALVGSKERVGSKSRVGSKDRKEGICKLIEKCYAKKNVFSQS